MKLIAWLPPPARHPSGFYVRHAPPRRGSGKRKPIRHSTSRAGDSADPCALPLRPPSDGRVRGTPGSLSVAAEGVRSERGRTWPCTRSPSAQQTANPEQTRSTLGAEGAAVGMAFRWSAFLVPGVQLCTFGPASPFQRVPDAFVGKQEKKPVRSSGRNPRHRLVTAIALETFTRPGKKGGRSIDAHPGTATCRVDGGIPACTCTLGCWGPLSLTPGNACEPRVA